MKILNKKFGSWEQIKRFELTPDIWSIDAGHLTPTMKLKRKIIKEIYKDIITIIIPRHINRAKNIETICKKYNLISTYHSCTNFLNYYHLSLNVGKFLKLRNISFEFSTIGITREAHQVDTLSRIK